VIKVKKENGDFENLNDHNLLMIEAHGIMQIKVLN
tara:strand:- start:1404 stop:1508 length:105 start_codon:yes stop_codon:yes gene_type:complete